MSNEQINRICDLLREKLNGNRSKSGSGVITIQIDPFVEFDGKQFSGFHIELGGYDLEGLNRHHEIGSFTDLEKGLDALEDVIKNTQAIEFL